MVPAEKRVAAIMNTLGNPRDLQKRYLHDGEIGIIHLEGLVDTHLSQESVVDHYKIYPKTNETFWM